MVSWVNPIDVEPYLDWCIDFKAHVRRPEQLNEEVKRIFCPDPRAPDPTMFSTKLRDRLQFRPGELTVWAGYNGHRKSTFVGQLAADLCVQRKRVFVISPEMHPQRTLARMICQMSAQKCPSDDTIEQVTAYLDERLWLLDYQGDISPGLCRAAMAWFCDQGAVQPHFVIDSMMMIVSTEERSDEQKRFITHLVRFAQQTWSHIHLVCHVRKPAGSNEPPPPSKYDIRGSAAITDQASNVVMIWANHEKQNRVFNGENVDENEPDVLVTIEKQRNGEFEGRLKMWFDKTTFRFMNEPVRAVEPYVMEKSGG